MPKSFERIKEAISRSISGKINTRTKKPYTGSEIFAISTDVFKKKGGKK